MFLCGFGSVFVFFVGIWLFWPAEVGRIYRIWEMEGEGCSGHGLHHLLSASAAEIVFSGILVSLHAWVRPGLPPLSNLAGPVQHFLNAIFEAWRDKVSLDLCRQGLVVLCWMFMAPCSFLLLLM